MLRSVSELEGYGVEALDGTIGSVKDFYFDDSRWTVRYVVVDTARFLPGRKVLVSPASCLEPDGRRQLLPVTLTKEQIRQSPDFDTAKPVSRQYETELIDYYQWPVYWGGPVELEAGGAARIGPSAGAASRAALAERQAETNLRSSHEMRGYRIEATDGEIGHVEDFVADTEGWNIRYAVVDTRNYLPGRKVLISPDWIHEVSWAKRHVVVDLSRDEIKRSPEFDPYAAVNREYEVQLYDFYGRPKYW
jgi:hypothetical protein